MYRLIILISHLFVFTSAFSSTYYSNNADISILTNWWTNSDGTGSNPSNFTSSGDIFEIQSGQICPISNNITFGNGTVLIIYGTLTVNGTSSLTIGSTTSTAVCFQVKNGGTFSNQTTGNITFYGAVQIDAGGTWSGTGTTGNNITFYSNLTNNSSIQITTPETHVVLIQLHMLFLQQLHYLSVQQLEL